MFKLLRAIFEWLYWIDWLRIWFWMVVLTIVMCCAICIKTVRDAPPRVEETRILAVGELTSIRATGDFGIYNTELKFEDGSMLVVTYSFSRRHNLRVGMRYKIWDSSFYGYQCKLLVEQ